MGRSYTLDQIPVYSSLSALASDTSIFSPGALVAVTTPPTLYLGQPQPVQGAAATSTDVNGTMTYWVSVSGTAVSEANTTSFSTVLGQGTFPAPGAGPGPTILLDFTPYLNYETSSFTVTATLYGTWLGSGGGNTIRTVQWTMKGMGPGQSAPGGAFALVSAITGNTAANPISNILSQDTDDAYPGTKTIDVLAVHVPGNGTTQSSITLWPATYDNYESPSTNAMSYVVVATITQCNTG